MKKVGMVNGHIDSVLNRQGHMDLMMVVDVGFPCPVCYVLNSRGAGAKVDFVDFAVLASNWFESNP